MYKILIKLNSSKAQLRRIAEAEKKSEESESEMR